MYYRGVIIIFSSIRFHGNNPNTRTFKKMEMKKKIPFYFCALHFLQTEIYPIKIFECQFKVTQWKQKWRSLKAKDLSGNNKVLTF